MVISPYARRGYIDHQTLSFDAIIKFIEDDFLDGQRLDSGREREIGAANLAACTCWLAMTSSMCGGRCPIEAGVLGRMPPRPTPSRPDAAVRVLG